MTPTDRENQQADPAALAPSFAEIPASRGRAVVDMIRMLSDHPEHAPYLKELIESERNREVFDQDWRSAKVFAMSGKFDDIKGATQEQAVATAMAKIRIGRDWGMTDSDSIANIYFVNGRPAVMTDFLASRMQEAGFSWDPVWSWEEDTVKGKKNQRCTGCTLWLKRYNPATQMAESVLDREGVPVRATFTESDAERAVQYDRNGKATNLMDKQTYKSYPQEMFFWKALGRLRKFYMTGILRGAVQVELARELPPPSRETAQIEGPEEEAITVDVKPLSERILEQREPGEGE